MQQVNLIEASNDETGIYFKASDEAPSFIDLLQTSYSLALKDCARWLADQFRDRSTSEIEGIVSERIGRWTAEFRTATDSSEIGL
ncbi:hypothetical protein AEGHOMDF_3816 [Methylobacterium soli]|nr:hypothetical protein AEGHOMDF_3816 [Methylobacterium soli]